MATESEDEATPSDAGSLDRFDRLLRNAGELLRLPRWAAAALVSREARSFAGFSALLDAALPHDAGVETRLARAVRLPDNAIMQLRHRELDPSEVPPQPLATIGRAMRLEWETFDTLITRDLAWFAEESPLAMLRQASVEPVAIRDSLKSAWERAALDDASDLG